MLKILSRKQGTPSVMIKFYKKPEKEREGPSLPKIYKKLNLDHQTPSFSTHGFTQMHRQELLSSYSPARGTLWIVVKDNYITRVDEASVSLKVACILGPWKEILLDGFLILSEEMDDAWYVTISQ